jgi:acyl-CoA reductase-like NAD-dependent aldehyde dehydrogenase
MRVDEERRELLYRIADALQARGDEVVALAGRETGLPEARLRGELDRTTGQLRLLGDYVAAGRHRVTRHSPGAAPGGGDVVTTVVPVGPVAVFAASNFPLAFGVLGGDTASALAAGCPVVVKAHPAQPETSRLLAEIAGDAITLVEGAAPEVSLDLVRRPDIRAVGFTGSLQGGRALLAAAMSRPDPIPVYAEMGSLNPVFALPGALANSDSDNAENPGAARASQARPGREHVAALTGAVTNSAGQLCTKPGLVVVPDTGEGEKFAQALAESVAAVRIGHRMLTPGMAAAHAGWLDTARTLAGVTVVAGEPGAGDAPVPFALRVDGDALHGDLVVEHFGPTVVIATAPLTAYAEILRRLEGSLTATLLGTEADLDTARELLPDLAALAGRLVWNGVPTGVAVCDAMQHGGPWPATSAPWSTSVGTAAVERFIRPVAMQGFPAALLS